MARRPARVRRVVHSAPGVVPLPPRRINEIVHGKRAVTADTALRLTRYFGTSDRFWLNLQRRFELEREKDRLGDRLQREVRALAEVG